MTEYADNLANRIDLVHHKLQPKSDLHLARSCFAALLLEAYTQAQTNGGGSVIGFRETVGAVIDEAGLPIFDEIDTHNTLPGKRQPSLRESFDATLDRYAILDELESVFAGPATSVVYGGSMKYGPFINVRAGADASDLDLVVVTDGEVLEELDWRGLMDTLLIDDSDKLTFFARCGLQRTLFETDKIDIMSQRFTVMDRGYTISAHFMPMSFVDVAYPGAIDTVHGEKDHHKYVRDYKERPFERPQVTNYDMSRQQHGIPVYNKPVEGGFIASNPAYSIIQGHYVPGMYQNLVLPDARHSFDVNGEATAKLSNFAKMVAVQEQQERLDNPKASIANTEPRKPIIPVDVSDILNL